MEEKKTYLSQKKHTELKKELKFLTSTRRQEIANLLEEAKSFGDLSENAEYHQAREAQAALESRVQELEDILRSVEIVSHQKSSVVAIGSTVTVENFTSKQELAFEIVGSEEADMKQRKISLNAPLGKALIGNKKDDMAEFKTPTGKKIKYKILKIE